MDESTLLDIFDGVPTFETARAELNDGIKVVDLLGEKVAVFPSKGECRKTIQAGGLSINKNKIATPEDTVGLSDLLNDKYFVGAKRKEKLFIWWLWFKETHPTLTLRDAKLRL